MALSLGFSSAGIIVLFYHVEPIDIKVTIVMVLMVYTCHVGSSLHPLILIPGSGGNQLEARFTAEYKATSLLCSRFNPLVKQKGGWFRLWFASSVLFAPFTKCFAERMMLYYDLQLDDYRNAPGIETRVPNFGSTDSLLYLDPNLKHITSYMATLVKSLEQLGYKEGETLFGAPYDFRYGIAAQGHPFYVGSKFLNDLKKLIENSSLANGGKPVILVSHSLGGLFVLQLLNKTTLLWRQKFIKHLVTLSVPWGGTVQEMLTFGSGNSLGVPLVNPLLVRAEQRSSESNLWLLPSPKIYGAGKPLVITPNASYSAYDIAQFLVDIGFSEGVVPYNERILPLVNDLVAPEVNVTCIIGSGVSTPDTLFYEKSGFDEQPKIVYGDGDGTVNMISLLALETEWADKKNHTLKVIKLPGVTHSSILKDDTALDEIMREIVFINSPNMNA